MHLFRELLDKQIEDRDDERMGRVDAIGVELRPGAPPRVVDIELGGVSIAARLHPRLEALAMRLHKKLGVRRSARYHIPWEKILDVNDDRVKVDVCADDTPAMDWEKWLRRHVIGKIPGASTEEEE
ncbi:MAG TPA: hypothetical protein VJ867_09510 [Gemmatimonadaceae bacterium]|nr:hypothetical protein [Gemmatimonadaceae bacterium]